MQTSQDVKNKLSVIKEKISLKYGVRSLAFFGSYSRDEQNKNSDLDVLVEFNKPIGIRFIDLAQEIEDAIGFKVDLVSRKGIKNRYFKAIESDLIYV